MQIDRLGPRVLLLIDNVKTLFKTICRFRTKEVRFSTFRIGLENALGKRISRKYAEGYFYSATVFDLLLGERGKYRLSASASLLCSLYDDSRRKAEYSTSLAALLLTNKRKGKLFNDFLQFVGTRRTMDEICREFGEVTGKSLVIWAVEAGLVIRYLETVRRVEKTVSSLPPSLEDFHHALRSAYDEMQATDTFGVRKIFVGIAELRLLVSAKMSFFDRRDFDNYLERLLDSEYGKRISLHGAPSHIIEQYKEPFEYKGRVYLYLSMGV